MNSSNNTIWYTLIGLTACVLALQKFSETKEHFAGNLPGFTVKAQRVMMSPGPNKGDFIEIPGNYQSMLSPRFSNVDYGASIRYNVPSQDNMAANAENPIGYGNMIYNSKSPASQVQLKENFGTASGCRPGAVGSMGNGASSSMKTSNIVPPNYSAGNYSQALNSGNTYTETTDMLPVQAMNSGGQMLNALGETETQPIIYDRYIFANQKSRLQGLGDPIRGDLPIVPVRSEWFRPSVHPQIDLRSGAILAMSGADNSTSKELLALQSAASGGLLDTGSGVNYSIQRSPYLSAAGGDIQVRSFV